MRLGVCLTLQLLCGWTVALPDPEPAAEGTKSYEDEVPVAVPPSLLEGYEYLGSLRTSSGYRHVILNRMQVSMLEAREFCLTEVPSGNLFKVDNQTDLNFLNDILPLDFCWVRGYHHPSVTDFGYSLTSLYGGNPVKQDCEEDESSGFGLTVSTYNRARGGKMSIKPVMRKNCFICSSISYDSPPYASPDDSSAYAPRAYPSSEYASSTYYNPAPSYQSYQQPSYQVPSYQAPMYQAPSYQAPAYQAPAYSYQQSSYQQPSYDAPAYSYQQPQYQESSYSPSYTPRGYATPAYGPGETEPGNPCQQLNKYW